MKRSRFTEHQIIKFLKEAEAGVAVTELSRKYGFSTNTFYRWKSKYSGMDASALKRLKELGVWQCQTLAIAKRLPGRRKPQAQANVCQSEPGAPGSQGDR